MQSTSASKTAGMLGCSPGQLCFGIDTVNYHWRPGGKAFIERRIYIPECELRFLMCDAVSNHIPLGISDRR